MEGVSVGKEEFARFMKWCLPRLNLRWAGFRKVSGTVRKRVGRRIGELGLADLAAYRARLEGDPSEWHVLDGFCRIPISRFYRDKGVYEALAAEVLPACAEAARKRGGAIGVLSAGCASGEEPYTVNLIWRLCLSERFPGVDLQVLASDIDAGMLQRAERACYSASSFRDMPESLLEQGFFAAGGDYCLRDAFRQGVRFEKADLRQKVPPGPFDLILCRNTAFTYFERAVQAGVFSALDASLREGGFLVIGAHESLPVEAPGYARLRPGAPVFQKRARMP
jgi:chemotaxis protein methyltransferase CheR